MKLFFKNYSDLYKEQKLSDTHYNIIFDALLNKLVSMNKNDHLDYDTIKINLRTLSDSTSFLFFRHHKDFCTLSINFLFFEKELNIKIFVYYDENEKYSHFIAKYESYDYHLYSVLNLNKFNNYTCFLSFNLGENDNGYSISVEFQKQLKEHHILSSKKIIIEFNFKNNQTLEYKSFLIREFNSYAGTSFRFDNFESISHEILFLSYLEHVISGKESIDSEIFKFNSNGYNEVSFSKDIIRQFTNNIENEDFLNCMKVIEMVNL